MDPKFKFKGRRASDAETTERQLNSTDNLNKNSLHTYASCNINSDKSKVEIISSSCQLNLAQQKKPAHTTEMHYKSLVSAQDNQFNCLPTHISNHKSSKNVTALKFNLFKNLEYDDMDSLPSIHFSDKDAQEMKTLQLNLPNIFDEETQELNAECVETDSKSPSRYKKATNGRDLKSKLSQHVNVDDQGVKVNSFDKVQNSENVVLTETLEKEKDSIIKPVSLYSAPSPIEQSRHDKSFALNLAGQTDVEYKESALKNMKLDGLVTEYVDLTETINEKHPISKLNDIKSVSSSSSPSPVIKSKQHKSSESNLPKQTVRSKTPVVNNIHLYSLITHAQKHKDFIPNLAKLIVSSVTNSELTVDNLQSLNSPRDALCSKMTKKRKGPKTNFSKQLNAGHKDPDGKNSPSRYLSENSNRNTKAKKSSVSEQNMKEQISLSRHKLKFDDLCNLSVNNSLYEKAMQSESLAITLPPEHIHTILQDQFADADNNYVSIVKQNQLYENKITNSTEHLDVGRQDLTATGVGIALSNSVCLIPLKSEVENLLKRKISKQLCEVSDDSKAGKNDLISETILSSNKKINNVESLLLNTTKLPSVVNHEKPDTSINLVPKLSQQPKNLDINAYWSEYLSKDAVFNSKSHKNGSSKNKLPENHLNAGIPHYEKAKKTRISQPVLTDQSTVLRQDLKITQYQSFCSPKMANLEATGRRFTVPNAIEQTSVDFQNDKGNISRTVTPDVVNIASNSNCMTIKRRKDFHDCQNRAMTNKSSYNVLSKANSSEKDFQPGCSNVDSRINGFNSNAKSATILAETPVDVNIPPENETLKYLQIITNFLLQFSADQKKFQAEVKRELQTIKNQNQACESRKKITSRKRHVPPYDVNGGT